VARDAAFTFLYPHLLAGWRRQGAEILFFSPLADEAPPDGADSCWLPGGYPELHGATLANATRFKSGLRRFAETRPVHGECGGYMILGAGLTDASGQTHEMVRLLNHSTSFAARKMHLGYRRATLLSDSALGMQGTSLRGHEFHYATVSDPGDNEAFAALSDASGAPLGAAGSRRGHVSGSFFHLIAQEE
jgi:cobyrinic acid a,c-diamide synthase